MEELDFEGLEEFITPSEQTNEPVDAITQHHLNNLKNGTYVKNDDGSVSTVKTMQVDFDGIPTLIPSVWNGKIIKDPAEAARLARNSGIKWPQADTHEALREFDIKIHKAFDTDIEKYIPKDKETTEELDFEGLDQFVSAQPQEEVGFIDEVVQSSPMLQAIEKGAEGYEDIPRQLGLTARAGAEGLAGAAGIFTDPMAEVVNTILPDEYKIGKLRDSVSQILTDMGVPEPENTTERIVQQASQALVGTGGAIKTGATLGSNALTDTGKALTQSFIEKSAQQAGGAIGGAIGQKGAEEAGLGAVGQTVGALAGGIGGYAGVSSIKSSIQSKEQLKTLMKTDPTNKEIAKVKLQNGQIVPDKVATETIRQGFDDAVVSSVKSSTPIDKKKMVQMVNILKNGRKSAVYSAKNRPSDIIGKSMEDRVDYLVKTNRKAGTEIEKASNSLRGKKVDSTPINDNFLGKLENIGVKAELDENGKRLFSLKGSDIEGDTASKALLNKIFDRAVNTSSNDAYDLHRLKRFIDTQVSYGKTKANPLSKTTEGILKSLRRDINEKLGEVSEPYKNANTKFSDTINAIDNIQKAVGTSIDMNSPNAAKAFGTSSRKLLSNYSSRVQMIDALDELDTVAKKYGKQLDDDIVSQVIFANELDRMFGAVAKTSLQGSAEQAAKRGAEVARRNITETALELAGKGIDKVRKINEEKAIEAIEKLLKDNK